MNHPRKRPPFRLKLSSDKERMAFELKSARLSIFGACDNFERRSCKDLFVIGVQAVTAVIPLISGITAVTQSKSVARDEYRLRLLDQWTLHSFEQGQGSGRIQFRMAGLSKAEDITRVLQ